MVRAVHDRAAVVSAARVTKPGAPSGAPPRRRCAARALLGEIGDLQGARIVAAHVIEGTPVLVIASAAFGLLQLEVWRDEEGNGPGVVVACRHSDPEAAPLAMWGGR